MDRMNWKKAMIVAPMSATLLFTANGGIVSADTMEKPTVETAAVDLRSNLGQLLSEHAYLAIETMRNGAAGSEDFEASSAALTANTEDLSAAIESVYGKEAGQAFKKMWSEHIGYFVDYVKATGNEDEDAKQKALDELSKYRADFSQFLENATEERLEADALAEGLQQHVNQLIGAFNSYVDGDYQQAYEQERKAINHMHMVAKGLSTAITDQFPDKFNNTMAVTPAGDLRADLNYLLSEHAGIAISAMQNGISEAPEFDASAKVLGQNTEDLSKAIASVYGDEAGEAFKKMWSEHVGYFVDYVNATANEDEEAQKEALTNLENYREDFSMFMEKATEGNVSADMLAKGLQQHVDQLIGSFESYADGNYDEAFTTAREAYGHMYGASKMLSSGIVMQFPDKFANDMPSDMPKTGFAPAEENNDMLIAWMVGISVFGLAAFAAIRKFRTNEK